MLYNGLVVGGAIMQLRDYRINCGMTQKQASAFLGVSDKTYFRYENDTKYINSLKYLKMCELLAEKSLVDETHGIISIDYIKKTVDDVFNNYDINYCYLFGSYAKGKQTEASDVDLLIDAPITGLKYYGLLQELMDRLHKKVDLITFDEALNNKDFLKEVFKDGIRIYSK